ncbi:hypothetical protein ILUMI_04101 [Ignelater luminosus]|uniref:DUF7041 domain-containing protein n=1 Tax=Ignelater luminosus TaxID=2038154 RepID=A0A8K0DF29_IGNLU|nr:hypothetical protein ILUMI_04101 [Ignelater luminosus]
MLKPSERSRKVCQWKRQIVWRPTDNNEIVETVSYDGVVDAKAWRQGGMDLQELTKFNHVLTVLSPKIANEVADVITKPNSTQPYSKLKEAILNCTSLSDSQNLKQLLSGEKLDSGKPSQPLRRMRLLIKDTGSLHDEVLKELSLQLMLFNVKQILLSISDATPEQMAHIANRILTYMSNTAFCLDNFERAVGIGNDNPVEAATQRTAHVPESPIQGNIEKAGTITSLVHKQTNVQSLTLIQIKKRGNDAVRAMTSKEHRPAACLLSINPSSALQTFPRGPGLHYFYEPSPAHVHFFPDKSDPLSLLASIQWIVFCPKKLQNAQDSNPELQLLHGPKCDFQKSPNRFYDAIVWCETTTGTSWIYIPPGLRHQTRQQKVLLEEREKTRYYVAPFLHPMPAGEDQPPHESPTWHPHGSRQSICSRAYGHCWNIAATIPISDITAQAFCDHLVVRFRILSILTTDRGRQFESALFSQPSQARRHAPTEKYCKLDIQGKPENIPSLYGGCELNNIPTTNSTHTATSKTRRCPKHFIIWEPPRAATGENLVAQFAFQNKEGWIRCLSCPKWTYNSCVRVEKAKVSWGKMEHGESLNEAHSNCIQAVSKTKVIGAKGVACSCTTSGPGKENITILSAVSAAGNKAPFLIVFKGKNVWGQWMADKDANDIDLAYAASSNGRMKSDITHVDRRIVKLAQENYLTILKLPPYTSHLLQPLDLAVFKSFKTAWDEELVALINLNPSVIQNGCKKAGICPSNSSVIPKEKCQPDALKRFDNAHKINTQVTIAEETHNNHSEQLLLQTVKQNAINNHNAKKRRVATGAEVITHKNLDDLYLMQNNKPSAKAIKKQKCKDKDCGSTSSKSSSKPLYEKSDNDLDFSNDEDHEKDDTLDLEKALKLCLSIKESKQQSVEISSSTANIHGISTRKLERVGSKHCSSCGEIATPEHSRKPPGQWYQRDSGKPVQKM